MKILNCEQGGVEWLYLRAGIVTASECDALVTPLWKVKTGDGPHTYMVRKLAEKWSGPLLDKKSFAMEQGTILEQETRPWYEFEYGVKVETVGLITTDNGRAGCSPDGLLTVGHFRHGMEIKCPERPNHIRYLLDGEIPQDYVQQVQFSLYVTGFPAWKFVSYRRNFPALVVTVEPDPKAQAAIEQALDGFFERFDAAWEKLCALNGGPPPPVIVPKTTDAPIKFTWEEQDDITP